jgi:dienelactone hydrolase
VRPAELALLATVLAGVVRPSTRLAAQPLLATVSALAVVAVASVHLAVEGARWQLAPLYLVAAVVVAAAAIDVARPPLVGAGRRWWTALGLLAVVGGGAGWSLPVPTLPAPGGPLPVGTTVVSLEDADRLARYGSAPASPRELVLQVWYPADPDARVDFGPWVPAGAAFGREAADWLGLPAFTLDHVGLVRSHATTDAPATPQPGALPVVLYAHGWGGFRTIQSDLAEHLASRGYVVAALDHTHGAVATAFPDGEVVPIDPDALPAGAPSASYDLASQRLVETFAGDLAFLLDELEEGAIPALTGRLDLERVGVVGHSTGGGAAVQLCAEEPRCAAVVGFDPWIEPVPDAILGAGIDVPFLALRSEEWVGNANDARLRRLRASSSEPAVLVSVAGTTHRDVTLLPFLTPLSSQVGLAGPTSGVRTHALTAAWTDAWFDRHLRGSARDPATDPPPFDEATVDEATVGG